MSFTVCMKIFELSDRFNTSCSYMKNLPYNRQNDIEIFVFEYASKFYFLEFHLTQKVFRKLEFGTTAQARRYYQ